MAIEYLCAREEKRARRRQRKQKTRSILSRPLNKDKRMRNVGAESATETEPRAVLGLNALRS